MSAAMLLVMPYIGAIAKVFSRFALLRLHPPRRAPQPPASRLQLYLSGLARQRLQSRCSQL